METSREVENKQYTGHVTRDDSLAFPFGKLQLHFTRGKNQAADLAALSQHVGGILLFTVPLLSC